MIKLNRGVAGGVFTYAAGQVVVAPEDRADDLVRAGHAEYVDAEKPADRAQRAESKQAKNAEKR